MYSNDMRAKSCSGAPALRRVDANELLHKGCRALRQHALVPGHHLRKVAALVIQQAPLAGHHAQLLTRQAQPRQQHPAPAHSSHGAAARTQSLLALQACLQAAYPCVPGPICWKPEVPTRVRGS